MENLQPTQPLPQTADQPTLIREGVGIFDNLDQLDAAIFELEKNAFNRNEISVLASKGEVEQRFGKYATAYELADHPDAPRGVFVVPEEKALGMAVLVGGGAYAGAVSGLLFSALSQNFPYALAAIAGGVIGAALGGLVAKLLRDKFNADMDHQMRQGGLVLWVRIFDPRKWKLAREIMQRHGGQFVHLHQIPAG